MNNMNPDPLKKELSHYLAPEVPTGLEERLWEAIGRLPVPGVQEKVWLFQQWSWSLTGFAAALSVLISTFLGHALGSSSLALPFADVLMGVGGGL